MNYLKNLDTKKRWSIFPITHPDLWSLYKNAVNQFWVAEEPDLSQDNFESLSDDEKLLLKNILSFFAVSDGLVIENLAVNFLNEVDVLEAQYYYTMQAQIEQVHAEMYSLLIETYIKDEVEKESMFNAITEIETVKKKSEWALKWIDNPSFAKRLVAFSLVEGLSFASVFSSIFYFRSRNKMAGLCSANELIFRDEVGHYEFAVNLYKNYLKEEYKLSSEEIKEIVLSCCEVEESFIIETVPSGLPGLTKEDLITYVRYVADIILTDYGIEKHFNASNPLDYMARIGLSAKNNFFENRTGEYTRLEIPTSVEDMYDDNF